VAEAPTGVRVSQTLKAAEEPKGASMMKSKAAS